MDEPDSFGGWIRRRRKALDLTREALAERVGCAVVTIRKIESDERRPSRQIAERIAEALAIPDADRAAFLQAARAELAVARLGALPPPATPPTPPARARQAAARGLRGYTLHEQIGAGGFGVVYRATQPGVGREVAVKIVRPELADRPDFVRRFEAEARLVARLEHPHIVPLYDYWREPGGAYLVMRYVRGGSARDALGAPWPLERCASLLEQVGSALAFAHGQGVIHRDLKPGNVLLDAEGHAYLADFGIARDARAPGQDEQTAPGAVVGTPDYLSPEQLRDEPITPASDVYALGVLLYVLLAGAHPLGALAPAERLARQLSAPLPPLRAMRPDLPAPLEAVIARATEKAPAERFQTVAELVAAWRAAFAGGETGALARARGAADEPTALAAPVARNPYKGLRPFGEGDEADFFGRERLTRRLVERMAEVDATPEPAAMPGDDGAPPAGGRFLAVVGPSGSGKSSVVRAGLLPALRRGALPGSERWFVAELLPGAHPLEELEAALLRVAVNPPERLLGQLREDERGLLRALKRVLPADPAVELLLVIDQLEELFTLVEDEAARAHVLAGLVAAVTDPRSRLRLVVTLRADFYDRPLLYPAFAELMRDRSETVLPLSAPELRRAIVGPAASVGLAVEDDLVAEMVRDVGEQPGALPLLQFALTELYEARRGPALILGDYRASGGVAGALARRADAIYGRLSPDEQGHARQIFLRLIAPGEGAEDTRRRVRLSELAVGPGGVGREHPVLARYAAHRLLTFDRDPLTREPTVEVAHEALIRSWGRLRAWLGAAREELRTQRRLTAAAAEWGAAGRDPSFLASGARLAQFAALAEGETVALNQDERAFLEASQAAAADEAAVEEERRRRELEAAQRLAAAEGARADQERSAAARLRRRAVALAGALVAALALAGAALYFGLAADRNARAAEEASRLATSRELAAAAVSNLDVDPERSILLALRANEVARTRQAGDALHRAVLSSRLQRVIVAAPDFLPDMSYNLFSPDGKRISTSQFNFSGSSTTSIRDLASGEVHYTIPGFSGATRWPGGGRLVTEHPPGDQLALTTWETGATEARETAVITLPERLDNLWWYDLSPDYSLVAVTRRDGRLTLYRMADGQELFGAGDPGTQFFNIAFSDDGGRLAASTQDGRIFLWDLVGGPGEITGVRPAIATDVRPLTGHTDPVNFVAFSPDGALLASAGVDATARVWDLTLGDRELVADFPPDANDPRLRHTLRGHTNELTSVAWSPDGARLASASRDRQVIIWDALVGERLFSLVGHTGLLFLVQFSPDGALLNSGSEDGTVRVWDVTPAHELRSFTVTPPSNSNYWTPMEMSRDGARLIAANPAVVKAPQVFDAATGAPLAELAVGDDRIAGVAMSADGSVVATASSATPGALGSAAPSVAVWDASTGALIRRFPSPEPFFAVALSDDGAHVAATASGGAVHLWDVASGDELPLAAPGPAYETWPVAFSPDGARLVAGTLEGLGKQGVIDVWDVADGRHLMRIPSHDTRLFSLAYSPDGARLASASRDGTAKIWDATSGKLLHTLVGHTSTVMGVAWSPDGAMVASAALDLTIKLWDAATGEELRTFFTPSGTTNLAFSPDGRQLFATSVDGVARVYLLELDDLIALAHTRVTRGLTPEECRTYLHSETCKDKAHTNPIQTEQIFREG